MLAEAVGSCRAGINQGNLIFAAGFPNFLAVGYVQLIEYGLVKFGGIGTCAEVENKLYVLEIGIEPSEKGSARHIFLHNFTCLVRLFFRMGKIIDGNNGFKALLVQAGNKAASYKAGGSGYNYHGQVFSRAFSGRVWQPFYFSTQATLIPAKIAGSEAQSNFNGKEARSNTYICHKPSINWP